VTLDRFFLPRESVAEYVAHDGNGLDLSWRRALPWQIVWNRNHLLRIDG
jgi:hypothetical protein